MDGSALSAALDLAGGAARRAFPGAAFDEYLLACRDVAEEAGTAIAASFARHAPACAASIGPEAAFRLADALVVVSRAEPAAALALAAAAPRAARRLRAPDGFQAWLDGVLLLAQAAPEMLRGVLDRSESLLGELGGAGFLGWVREGLRATEAAPGRRAGFFALRDRAGRQALDRAEAELGFAAVERALAGFGRALWGAPIQLRGAAPARPDQPRRAGFEGTVARLPDAFRGYGAAEARRLYDAAVAHIAGHLRHGGPKFAVGSLKPLQVALVSLVEDARVERLAMAELPGLRRLWLPFHVARPSSMPNAAALLARLARALADPAYEDPDAWVAKGRRLFEAGRERLDDPGISRAIGGLLGNDLGQMRVPFNAKTYVVEPPYRDDNAGLWDFGDGRQGQEDDDSLPVPVRTAPPEGAERPPRRDDPEPHAPADSVAQPVRARPLAADIGIPVARYPEWDYLISRERRDWTTVVEHEPPVGDAGRIAAMMGRDEALLARIATMIRAARLSRPARLRGQPEGDQLDLDAALAAAVDRRAGLAPGSRVYMRHERRARDLSVLLLLDASRSTGDAVPGAGRTVLQLEVEAAALLSQAMDGLGDPFALRAFCSDGRHEVRYYRIKDFADAYDDAARRKLAGVQPAFSTRMGAALRHAATELAPRRSYRRLLLLVTDGEPSDVDAADRRYLVEDARHAVHGMALAGLDVFCVGLNEAGKGWLPRIFGARRVLHIDRIERLPELLPALYLRIAA